MNKLKQGGKLVVRERPKPDGGAVYKHTLINEKFKSGKRDQKTERTGFIV